MSRDGQGTSSIAERLKARSEVDLKEVEVEIQKQHQQLANNLQESSTAVLRKFGSNLDAETAEIVENLRIQKTRIDSMLAEIAIRPRRVMRNVMITSAVIGGIVAIIPWAAMSWLGMSATGTAGTWLKQRTEISVQEARINVLTGITLQEIDGQTVLILPAGTERLHACGIDQTPCVIIGEGG